jgi:hypothetical protein
MNEINELADIQGRTGWSDATILEFALRCLRKHRIDFRGYLEGLEDEENEEVAASSGAAGGAKGRGDEGGEEGNDAQDR